MKEEPTYINEKEDKKVEFFLRASHQLKSPIAIIQWCLQSVVELAPDLDKSNREYINKALIQADAMGALITDMLQVFKLLRHQDGPKTYTPVNLNVILNQLVQGHTLIAENKGIRLTRGPIEVLPSVAANEPYLKQALFNLIDNAVKYTPSGKKVTISAKTVNHNAKVEDKKNKGKNKKGDNYIEISISDQGIGMTESDIAQLYTEFFRSQAARDMTHEGTGLGLVVVKHVIEDIGGHISVESEFGKGTTFIVRIPYQD